MNVSSFLKKAGAALASSIPLVVTIEGVVSAFIPQAQRDKVARIEATVNNDLSVFAGLAVQVDAIGAARGLDGAAKFLTLRPLIRSAMLSSTLVSAHRIGNNAEQQALFEKAVDEQTQAIVDLTNSLSDDGVKIDKAVG